KFGPPIRAGSSFHVHSLYGALLDPTHPFWFPPSRRTSATISPVEVNRRVVSFGWPGTSRCVTRSYFSPSALTQSLSFHSAAPGSTFPVFAASFASFDSRSAALYETP